MSSFLTTLYLTVLNVLPIMLFLMFFQLVVLRRPLKNPGRIILGFAFVLLGIALFIIGLERGLFPLGKTMARQLSNPEFLKSLGFEQLTWLSFYWIYTFAFFIGFSTTIAEPTLIAIAIKAEEISGGTISAFGLRISVALGVAVGISLGCFRIVTGTPLYFYIIVGYIIVIIQSRFAPKEIIPIAYDSGAVTTSTVTVPIVAALGIGLSSSIEGRSPLLDGFGLIAFASLFPMLSVMGYAQISSWWASNKKQK